LKWYFEKKGREFPLFDLLIATVALDHNGILITIDKRFEEIPGLKVIVLKI